MHIFSGKRNERVSWIAALKKGKVFAPLTFEGSCNRDLFETWLEKNLIPQLQPGDIIIIDNATFHKGQSIREIVEEVGCEIWYLPPNCSRFKQDRALVVCSQNLDEAES